MSRARVVVIEDDIDAAATLLEELVGRDYEVLTATTAKEGLEVVDACRPDVVLLDVALPGRSGPGLLAVLGRLHPWLPVIVVTSTIDARVLAQVAECKPFHLVHRPYDVDALDRLVAAAASERARRPTL
jgi:DNA-binding NtrC family response regulator